MAEEIRHHGLLLCYHCLGDLDPKHKIWVKELPELCPTCDKPISIHLLNIFTLSRTGLENELNSKAYLYLPPDENERIKMLGSNYTLRHGWEPYVSFILTAILSGIAGNFAYDVIKSLVKRLFHRRYPEQITSINVDYHIEFIFKFLQDYRQSDLSTDLKRSINLAQPEHQDANQTQLVDEQDLKELLSYIRRGINESVAEGIASSSSGESQESNNKPDGSKADA